MNPDQEYTARVLAETVLGTRDANGHPIARVTSGIADCAHVSVELRGMVQTLRQQILIDQAAIASRLCAELERVATPDAIDVLIREVVATEMNHIKSTLRETMRHKLEALVRDEIMQQFEDGPRKVVKQMVGALWVKLKASL